jgi:hypothetical protein
MTILHVMPRPDPAIVKAKLKEIARRYARKQRHATKPQFAAIRVAELNRLFRARYGEQLPDDADGRGCLWIVAQHLMQLAGHPYQRLMMFAAIRAPWLTITEATALLADVASKPMTWKADSLAWRLKLTYADRQALKIKTIGAIDVNRSQRAQKRRNASKKRSRLYRKRKALAANAT